MSKVAIWGLRDRLPSVGCRKGGWASGSGSGSSSRRGGSGGLGSRGRSRGRLGVASLELGSDLDGLRVLGVIRYSQLPAAIMAPLLGSKEASATPGMEVLATVIALMVGFNSREELTFQTGDHAMGSGSSMVARMSLVVGLLRVARR